MAKKFWLIDDDADDRELFCEAVGEIDPTVTCYCSKDGHQALKEMTDKATGLPAMIFIDINMPVMNGWQLLTLIKEKEDYKSIPVVMYSTSSYQKDKDMALQLGANGFFTKPNDYKELKALIRKMLGEG